MQWILKNLAFILPALVLLGVAAYALVLRELPQAQGRITGDFESARELAADAGVPLYVAVDASPH